MKLKRYLRDKSVYFFMYVTLIIAIESMLYLFKVPYTLMISVFVLMILFIALVTIYDYNRKKYFYDTLVDSLDKLDKKYLVTEVIKRPSFFEGQLIYDSLYEINKSMNEEIEVYKKSVRDFKEYIEMWIHEVKIPIASSVLILHNNKPDAVKKLKPQISRIENYVEQVLYYVRSENAEKDYLIKHCNLKDAINKVIRKNKDSIILKHISLNIEDVDRIILSDSKWIEFIINQIVSNSIKYAKDENACIDFKAEDIDNKLVLSIRDNGVGISENDLCRVFDKSFTGENGRGTVNSTGMGLYLSKELCKKLGHLIEVTSEKNSFTKVSITFRDDEYYSDVR